MRETALLADALAFIGRWGLTETEFGLLSVRSTQLIHSLRRGRSPRPATEARVRAFMDAGNPLPGGRSRQVAKSRETKRRNAEAAAAAVVFRGSDDAERAKTWLRKEGFTVFNAEIIRPFERGRFMVGTRCVDRDELIETARRRGWKE